MSVIASHLVFADPQGSASKSDDPDVVISRTAELLHPASHEALAEYVGDLRVTAPEKISDLPIPPLLLLQKAHTVSAEAERIIDTAVVAWSVILRTSDDEAVSAQYAARAAAALLSKYSDGIGVDLAIPRIWPRLALDDDPTRTADWFILDRTADDRTMSTTTRGLSRFGVPELRVVGVDAIQVPAWDAVLTGLAHRLVEAGATEAVPDRVDLGLRDIAAGYAEPVDADDPTLSRRTALELTYASDEVVEVTGPAVADLFGG